MAKDAKKEKKSKMEVLQEKFFVKKESSWNKFNNKQKKQIIDFSEKYKTFLKQGKTERLCINNILSNLKKNNFKDISKLKSLKKGDKFYKIVRGKAILAGIVGIQKDTLTLLGSHVDSPRLDLKPNPLYEDSDLSLLKTHYYGGIKKYHWVNTPLSLIGVAYTNKGKVEIEIGEKEDDPRFIIPDLLPHLSAEQMERPSKKLVQGEELNILFGNIPIDDKKINEKFKFYVLKELHDKYGIVEEDFKCAELELVPSVNPMDIGIDRSMVGAYGQDDKVCAYASMRAILDMKVPKKTAVAMFVDKEEIGSMGDTGAASYILQNFIGDYIELSKLKDSVSKVFERSKAISADVCAGVNPNYKDVNDMHNASVLGRGVSIEKYGGGGGKYSTHDAHAEYMQYIREMLNKNKISWQSGELGKIDLGGGGTIAMFISKYGMDCVDAGPSILGMHSPCEVVSKADIYSSYLLYKAFLED